MCQYYFECLDYRATERKLSAFLADFQEVPVEKLKPHQHAGVEFLYVMKGSLALKIGSEEFLLEPEDAIYFDSAGAAQLPQTGLEAVYGSDCHGTVEYSRLVSLLPSTRESSTAWMLQAGLQSGDDYGVVP